MIVDRYKYKFDSWEDFENWYYSFNECDSDDPDVEQPKLERFAEDNGIIITEDDPQGEVDRDNMRAIGLSAGSKIQLNEHNH